MNLEERFWSKVDKRGPDDCWLWTAGTFKGEGKYGWFWLNGRTLGAHVVAFELTYGPIPKNKLIDHLCNTPLCVNPRHLRLASRAENARNATLSKLNTSGFKGICWSNYRKTWVASITVNKKIIYLGCSRDPEIAHKMYCEGAKKYHGEFANTGDK